MGIVHPFDQPIIRSCIVLDSEQILLHPQAMLKKLCVALEIPFYTEMLNWPAGSKKEDGVWAKYWYKNVHQIHRFCQAGKQQPTASTTS